MQSNEPLELKNQIARYQYAADALCDLRTSIAPILAKRIIEEPHYQSWGMVGLLGTLYATDKLDGYLASRRAALVQSADEPTRQLITSDIQLSDAIAQGGRKDERADKVLTHTIFLSLAAREALNKNIPYGALIGGSDAVMFVRDRIVGKARDRAVTIGKKGDARKLGKYKQGLLVVTAMAAVAPLQESNFQKSVSRSIVSAGMIGGVALSIMSGIDQVRHLRT
jgi:phosphatidylglycerophosphate synthase